MNSHFLTCLTSKLKGCGFEASAKKEARKAEREKAREEYEKERDMRLAQQRSEQMKNRKEMLNSYLKNPNKFNIDIPFRVYWSEVHDIIYDIRYNGDWGKRNVSPFKLTDDEARILDFYKEGDTFYRFPDKAPSELIRKSFDETFSQYGKSLEEYMVVGHCSIHCFGKDLIIQAENLLAKKKIEDENSSQKKVDLLGVLPSSFVGIDFETLYAQRVSVCSVGMVKYKDGQIVDKFYSLIRPPFDYPGKKGNELSWIHGITKDMLIGQKTFAELLPSIEAFIDGLPLVAHNASVERNCFNEVCSFYHIDTKIDYNNILDTLTLSKQAEEKQHIHVEGAGSHSLDELCKRFGVEVKQHHNALDDAEMCGNLYVVFYKILNSEIKWDTNSKVQNNNNIAIEQPAKYEDSNQAKSIKNTGCVMVVIAIIFFVSSIAILYN